jgi:hypothetical protein
MKFLRLVGDKLRALVSLILPVFRKAKGAAAGGLPAGVRMFLHVMLVAAILVGLALANNHWQWLKDNLQKAPGELIREWLFLPLLFLGIYALWWLSHWLWVLLFWEEDSDYYPDIDAAWQEAQAALRKANLSLTDLPLFLILGRPEGAETAVFAAAKLDLVVKQTPTAPSDPKAEDKPLHLYATREAIYLTCADSSQIGLLARYLAGKLPDTGMSGMNVGGGDADGEDFDITGTLIPEAQGTIIPSRRAVGDLAEVIKQAEREGRGQGQYNKVDKRELRRVLRRDNPKASPMQNTALTTDKSARLRYLCRLLARARNPFCPVNGVLVLIPYAATDSTQDATYAGTALAEDLKVTGATLKVDCPHIALVCDMETATGFAEFIQRFNEKERRSRIGQKCSPMPDLRATTRTAAGADSPAARMLTSLADWICSSVVPMWVYNKFQIEKKDTDDRTALVKTNSRLFLLEDELKERSKLLGEILRRGFADRAASGKLLLVGCYLAGTGSESPDQEQAFVRAVLERLPEHQNLVYWNPATRAEEDTIQHRLTVGWITLGVLLLGMAGFTFYIWKLYSDSSG